MGEPLKRTFHGCLTCRKRKVRCQGGSPCQNCVRMNITCHSSFDTNLRVVVSTPRGQKAIGPGPPAETLKPGPRQSAASVQAPALTSPDLSQTSAEFEVQSGTFKLDFRNQAPAVFLPSPVPAYTQASSIGGGSLLLGDNVNLDPLALNRSWDFDFSLDPYVDYNFNSFNAAETAQLVGPGGGFDAFQATTPMSMPSFCCSSDSDASATSDNEVQESGTREWAPRRRKKPRRNKEVVVEKKDTEPAKSDSVQAKLYFKHYRECTQSALTSKVDARWSYHRFVIDFVTTCAEHCPLRLAVLAWTAKHCDPESKTRNVSMESWYSRAQDAMLQLMALSDATAELTTRRQIKNAADFVIMTSLYLNRFDILNRDLESVDHRLRLITEWFARNPSDLKLSAFSCKMLLWLCYLQVRISIYAATTRRTSTLLDELVKRPDYKIILERSHTYYTEVFGDKYPADELAQDIEKIPISFRLHETFRLMNDMLKYRSWSRDQIGRSTARFEELASAKQAAIESDIRRMGVEFGVAMITNPTASILHHNGSGGGNNEAPATSISRTSLNWLTVYAAFLTAKILWSRMLYPDIRTDDASRAAVASILQIAMRLRKLKGPREYMRVLSSMLWPLPLFVAGIETTDDIHADWMRLFMNQVGSEAGVQVKEVSAPAAGVAVSTTSSRTEPSLMGRGGMSGGAGGKAVLELMEKVRERQNILGKRVDVEAIAAEMSEAKTAFIF